jgi:hypothetical protein
VFGGLSPHALCVTVLIARLAFCVRLYRCTNGSIIHTLLVRLLRVLLVFDARWYNMHLFKCSIPMLGIFLLMVSLASACAIDPSDADSHRVQQDASGVSRIGEILARIASDSNYRAVKASVVGPPDEWDADEPRRLLIDHAYYSLFCRDPKSLLDLGPMHRGVSSKSIYSTILVFKNAELAASEVGRLKEKRLDNIGAIVLRSDASGFYIKTIGRSYYVVRHGARVVLLDTHDQEETMKAIAYKLDKAEW